MYNSPFLNEIYEFMMVRRYSKRTVSTDIVWIKRFINFNQKRHPKELDFEAVERFLTHLAVNRNVSSGTQKVALNAIAFLYNTFLEKDIGDFGSFRHSKKQAKLPIVLTQEEIKSLLSNIDMSGGQIQKVEHYLVEDIENEKFAGIWMPDALERKLPRRDIILACLRSLISGFKPSSRASFWSASQ